MLFKQVETAVAEIENTLADRGRDYGSFGDNALIAGRLLYRWDRDCYLTQSELGALSHYVIKVARLFGHIYTPNVRAETVVDTCRDLVGYAICIFQHQEKRNSPKRIPSLEYCLEHSIGFQQYLEILDMLPRLCGSEQFVELTKSLVYMYAKNWKDGRPTDDLKITFCRLFDILLES